MASVWCCLILLFLILTIFKIATSENSKNVCQHNFTASFMIGDCESSGKGTQYISSVTTGVNLYIQFPCSSSMTSSQTWCYFVKAPDNSNTENPLNICWLYECLPVNRQEVNLCEDNSTTADRLYLSSPQFFTRQTPNTTNDCRCRITTSSPANIRPLYVSDANGLKVTAGASMVPLSTNNSTVCVEGTVDIVVDNSNPVWLEVTGQNLQLKCNREIETINTSETKSGLCSGFTTTPWPMEAGEDTVVYIISVVGGVVVLVCGVVIAVIIRRRRTIGFPQLASSTNRSVIPDPRVSVHNEMSPALAGGSDAADVTEDIGVPHVYSSLTPPEERGIDNSSDNYTSLPQRYVNVTPRLQPQ